VPQQGATEKDVKQQVERDLEEIERLKDEAQQQGLAFWAPTAEQLEQKIRGVTSNSPYIYSAAWTSRPPAGGTADYRAYVRNPDPNTRGPLFVTLFWGMANLFTNIAEGLVGRDARWPYLSSEPFYLAPGATTTRYFQYVTPTVQPSTYLGNAVLWQGGGGIGAADVGVYYDRQHFWHTLTPALGISPVSPI
jgi:hypothetical protein